MTAPRSPGWYPAPSGGGEQWWNGVAWSESRRDGTTSRAAVTHVTPSGPPPAAAQAYGTATSQMTPAALAAFVTGLLSIVLPIAGIVAVILGVRALSGARFAGPLETSSRTYATIGIVIGAITSLFGVVGIIFFIVAIFSSTGFTIS